MKKKKPKKKGDATQIFIRLSIVINHSANCINIHVALLRSVKVYISFILVL